MTSLDISQEQPLFSIIVPVYNKESSITRCFESLANQNGNVPHEIIFVDDGSTDSSKSLCEEFARTATNAYVISKENGGVSQARNTGINSARGEFLLFLDADDALGDHTLISLSRFVAEHPLDDFDVISYPLKYVNPETGKTSNHTREKWLAENGIYSLADYPYVAQSTMNVCVRNRFDQNVLFDTTLKMGEDQLYITNNLARAAKIGCCIDAEYLYTRDGSGASSRRNNPLYAFSDMIELFSQLIVIANSNSAIASYAQQLVLYNVAWRIKSDMLFPVHLTGLAAEQAEQSLSDIMTAIPIEQIILCPYMNDYHKGFLFTHFSLLSSSPKIHYCPDNSTTLYWSELESEEEIIRNSGKACILLNDSIKWYVRNPGLILTKAMMRPNGLNIEGRLVFPGFPFMGKPTLLATTDEGESFDIPLTDSSFDYSGAKFRTTKCWTIRVVLPKRDSLKLTLRMSTDFGTIILSDYQLMKGMKRFNARRERRVLYYPDHVFSFVDNTIVLRKKTISDSVASAIYGAKRDYKNSIRRFILKLFKMTHPKKRIWLYSDLPTSQIEGNSFIQFQHDLEKYDGISRYYVTSDTSAFLSEHENLIDNVIRFGSLKHRIYSLMAEVILASYLERYTYLPYRKKVYSGLADLVGNQWHIYLQHGVLHAHLPWYYSLDRIAFDKEVVSTSFEIDNLTSNYCFPKEALITSGMPRFDKLSASHSKPRKILYAPSWRNYLVGGTGKQRLAEDELLLQSNFYRGFSELLHSNELVELLKSNDYTLDIKLHPNFSCYSHLLTIDSPAIHSVSDNIDENDYAIVITDFSSYVFDFIYAGASILYFMPDEKEFNAGLNHYRRLDMPFNRGFGPYTTTAADAISSIKRQIDYLDGKTDDPELSEFVLRGANLFLHKDGHNSDRLYESLLELTS